MNSLVAITVTFPRPPPLPVAADHVLVVHPYLLCPGTRNLDLLALAAYTRGSLRRSCGFRVTER